MKTGSLLKDISIPTFIAVIAFVALDKYMGLSDKIANMASPPNSLPNQPGMENA